MQNPTMREEEEQESLIIATAKVVKYLEPLMSRKLLCKFPDNTAFDFDYTQSSLWSPLLPRAYSPADFDFDFESITPRKLAFEFGFGLELEKSKSIGKKFRPNIKKKIAATALNMNLNLLRSKNKKRKKMASDFTPTPVKGGCAPIISKVTQGWNKTLKAASKHFKRKKRESSVHHAKLPNYLMDSNI